MATIQMNFLSMRLGMQTNLSVFLPSLKPGPDTAGKSYGELYPRDERFPTLWLLPTEYGDDGEYLRRSAVLRLAEKARLAVVMPCGYEKLYSDDPRGQKFTDYITEELWTLCTGTFPLSPRREDAFIGGASLGAYGALKCALAAPDRFSRAVLLGGAYEPDMKGVYLADLAREMARNGAVPHCALDDAPAEDAELTPIPGAPLPEVWMAWAAGSPLADYARRGEANLRSDGFAVTGRELPGAEDWDFRDQALRLAFRYLAEKEAE